MVFIRPMIIPNVVDPETQQKKRDRDDPIVFPFSVVIENAWFVKYDSKNHDD